MKSLKNCNSPSLRIGLAWHGTNDFIRRSWQKQSSYQMRKMCSWTAETSLLGSLHGKIGCYIPPGLREQPCMVDHPWLIRLCGRPSWDRAAKCGTSTCGRPPWSSKNPKRLKKNRPPLVGRGACVLQQHHGACMRVTTSTRPHAQWNSIPYFENWILGALSMLSPELPSTLQHAGQFKETMAEFHIQLSRSNSSHTVLTKCLNCLNQNLDAEIIFKSFFCNKSDQFGFFFVPKSVHERGSKN